MKSSVIVGMPYPVYPVRLQLRWRQDKTKPGRETGEAYAIASTPGLLCAGAGVCTDGVGIWSAAVRNGRLLGWVGISADDMWCCGRPPTDWSFARVAFGLITVGPIGSAVVPEVTGWLLVLLRREDTGASGSLHSPTPAQHRHIVSHGIGKLSAYQAPLANYQPWPWNSCDSSLPVMCWQ